MLLRVLKKDNLYYPQYWQEAEWVYDEETKLSGTRMPHWENFRDRRGKVFGDTIFYDREMDVFFKDLETAVSYAQSMVKKEQEENIKQFGEVVWSNTEL